MTRNDWKCLWFLLGVSRKRTFVLQHDHMLDDNVPSDNHPISFPSRALARRQSHPVEGPPLPHPSREKVEDQSKIQMDDKERLLRRQAQPRLFRFTINAALNACGTIAIAATAATAAVAAAVTTVWPKSQRGRLRGVKTVAVRVVDNTAVYPKSWTFPMRLAVLPPTHHCGMLAEPKRLTA
jgi:hypothetical protein